jgi:hypothetical protein
MRRQGFGSNHAVGEVVISITESESALIVAIISAAMAFAMLVLKIVEVSRDRR